jgi:N-acetylglucosamine-6-phosphate deacetylase
MNQGLTARDVRTGRWVRVTMEGRSIAAVAPAEGPDAASAADDWVAPAFWDLQFNGRWGVSFADPTLRPDQVAEIVRAQDALGSARVCPTLITAPLDAMRHGVAAIARACDDDREIADRVVGIHLEGPFISGVDGYRGAHPRDAVLDPDWDEFQSLQDASGGRVVLTTLAPERSGAIEFIRKVVQSGVTVALGHTAADGETLRAAVDAGATLSTHLGNGIVSPLPRHPNPIFEQAALDGLACSFIADGHHIDRATLRVLVRAKSAGRVILVSDASPLAGLPPGTYGPWAVHPSGKVVVAGTPYLAGSNQGLEVGLNNLLAATGISLADAFETVTTTPARLLGRNEPRVQPGRPADLVRFGVTPVAENPTRSPRVSLRATCVRGNWTDAGTVGEPGPAFRGGASGLSR